MSDKGVYVIVVGHNLEAKCDVANSLLNQGQLFRPFLCRRKIVLKSRRTVNGERLYFVATPDLTTPSWTHQEEDVKKFKTKVFLYVQDNDCIDSDDAESLKLLRKRFSEKSKSVPIVLVRYNTKIRRDESVLSLDRSVSEDFPQLTVEGQVTINKNDSFTKKSDKASEIIKLVVDTLKGDRAIFEGKMSVDDNTARASMNISSNSHDLKEDVSRILESVTTNRVRAEEEEFRSIELPNLHEEDWILFRKTLNMGRARSNHVRVNVVGNQGAGKTSLVKRLQGIDTNWPDKNQPPTEGLEINQVTTKCIERNGVRVWETKNGGYEQELNLQRMAFALHSVSKVTQEKEIVEPVDIDEDVAELELGSDYVEDAHQIQTTFDYGEHIDQKQKELYLRKVKQWRENSTEERMYVSYWDFAGQTTYYSTHQAFMAPSAVYVLVIDLSLDLHTKLEENLKFRTGVLKHYTVEETVKFWTSSIKAYTRDEQNGHAPFIIVGTHKDKVTNEEAREKFSQLRQVLRSFTHFEFVAIDNTLSASSDTDLQALRDKILNLGLGVIDEEIPAQWINLEQIVLQKKNAGASLLSFADIEDFDVRSDMPMKDPYRIEAFLEHEHRRGWLMHFCHVDLKNIIILEPAFLVTFFNILLRKRPSYEFTMSGLNKDGIVAKEYILEAASHSFNVPSSGETLPTIAAVLTHLHIMHKFEGDTYFIPCLLPHHEDRESFKDSYYEKAPSIKLSFVDAFVPPAFFHLLIVAMIEEPDFTVYKKKNTPRIYNLFVCFCFQRDTLWLEVFWHDCCIFFELKNYSSTKKISESGSNKMIEAMEIIQRKIEHILSVYRQDNVQYTFEVECPSHHSNFVDLQKAKDDGEVMCTDGHERHAVSWKTISQICPWIPNVCDDRLEGNQSRPIDKDLGRLAKHLTRENPMSLSSKLKLPRGNILADRAINEWPNSPDMQRLRLFRTWKETYPERSVVVLLNMLTKRKDYDVNMLTDILYNEVQYTEDYGIDCNVLDSMPDGDEDLLIASDYIGADYTFLMLELGLTFKDIEIKRSDNPFALRETIYKLFQTWRQVNDKESTPRILLNTAKFLGMNTAEIVSKFKERLVKREIETESNEICIYQRVT